MSPIASYQEAWDLAERAEGDERRYFLKMCLGELLMLSQSPNSEFDAVHFLKVMNKLYDSKDALLLIFTGRLSELQMYSESEGW